MWKSVMVCNGVGGLLGTNARPYQSNLNLAVAIDPLKRLSLLVVLHALQVALQILGVKEKLALPRLRCAVGSLPSPLLLRAIDEGANIATRLPMVKFEAVHRALETEPENVGVEHLG